VETLARQGLAPNGTGSIYFGFYKFGEKKMTIVPFNTLRYARTLQKAGIEDKIANAHATAQAHAWSEAIENQLATKKDIQNIDHRLSQEIQRVDQKVDRVDHKIDAVDKNLRLEIQLMGQKLWVKFGSLMVGGIAFLAGLITAFRFC
jgi:hypothetical protein